MRHSLIQKFLLLVLSVCIFQVIAYAQVTTTSVVGTVADTSSAAIPQAEVVITDVDRNQSKTARTDSQGAYRIDFLLTGNYMVTVSVPGFKKYVQHGIVLNAGVPATVDVMLAPGDITESVEVTSSAPLVNTTNAEVGTTIDTRQMVELPLVNRNPYQLLDLTPGVQTNSNIQSFGAPSQVTLINGGADNGAGSTNYFLDGAPNMTGLRNTGNILPNPDALQEFRVQTSNYGAPYGRFASGVVNALVKSGTNQVHGTVFEFIRNTALNARDWGSSPTLAKAPLHRNQFGATLGGPIFKDKTFFFGSYAGLRQSSSTFLNTAIVPSALERTGDFSQSLGTKPTQPGTNTPYSCNGRLNVICPNQLDPVAMNLLNTYVPLPNSTASTSGGSAPSWQGYYNSPYISDDFLLKINHQLSKSHSLAATYFLTAGNTSVRGGSSNVPYSTQLQTWRQQNAVINDTWTISNAIVNNIWLSYTRMIPARTNTPKLSLADFGSAFSPQGAPSLPNITVNGFFTLGNSISGPTATNNYTVRDLVTWTLGKHTFQFGGEFVLDKNLKISNLNNYGTFTFSGSNTLTRNALSDFLIGSPSAATQDSPANTSANTFTTSAFIQDDYRLSRQLTLNLGLRYDVQTPPTDSINRVSAYVPGQQSTVRPNAPIGLLFPGDKGIGRGIAPTRYAHLSPRLGFAFDPTATGKTSIRGGVGLFWGSVSEESWMASGNTVPFALRYTFPNTNTPTGPTLSNPYRSITNPFPFDGTLYPRNASAQPTSPTNDWPYTVQTNLSVQQQLTPSLVFSVAYVGSASRNQIYAPDLNYPTLNTNFGAASTDPSVRSACGTAATIAATSGNAQCRRAVQPLGQILTTQSGQAASYHSLQTSLTQQMSHHISLNGFYSWSKTLSTVGLESSGPGGTAQNYNNLRAERGRADNDFRHMATIGIVWNPDYYSGQNRLLRGTLNGWEISPLARLRSGVPFTITNNGVDANLDGQTNDRARVIGDPNSGHHTLAQWFNTAAFAQNPAVTGNPVDGNAPRNSITGPALHTIDLNLARTFPITERIKFQFRAEASNAFNIANYANPSGAVGTATFGQIRSAGTAGSTSGGAPRTIQFGGKFNF